MEPGLDTMGVRTRRPIGTPFVLPGRGPTLNPATRRAMRISLNCSAAGCCSSGC